jgi:hypothetical protein
MADELRSVRSSINFLSIGILAYLEKQLFHPTSFFDEILNVSNITISNHF